MGGAPARAHRALPAARAASTLTRAPAHPRRPPCPFRLRFPCGSRRFTRGWSGSPGGSAGCRACSARRAFQAARHSRREVGNNDAVSGRGSAMRGTGAEGAARRRGWTPRRLAGLCGQYRGRGRRRSGARRAARETAGAQGAGAPATPFPTCAARARGWRYHPPPGVTS